MINKICFLTPGSFPIPSGMTSSVENSVMNIAPRLVHEERSVHVIGRHFKDKLKYSIEEGVHYHLLRVNGLSQYLHLTYKALQRLNPSIVVVENRPSYIVYLKKKLKSTKFILSLHSTNFISEQKISKALLRKSFLTADGIVVNSQFLKEHIKSVFPELDFPIYVNYLGINPALFPLREHPSVQDIRQNIREKNGAHDQFVLLYSGRLKPYKGVHKLIEAFNLLRDEGHLMQLWILGGDTYGSNKPTPYVKEIRRLARRHEDSIRWFPFAPLNSVYHWYAGADLLICPSTGPEAFGLVNIEAMAMGLPVIGANTGGIPEIIIPNETGWLVPLDNMVEMLKKAILEACMDQEKLQKKSTHAREHVLNQFTWDHCAKRLEEIIHKIV